MSVKEVKNGQVAYETGAVRSPDAEGVRYDLISPIGLRRVAETCREGADKYSDYNWEKGMPISDLLNHAIAHAYKYLSGDRSEDHLAHAAWNFMGAMHSEELWPHLNKSLRASGCNPPAEATKTDSSVLSGPGRKERMAKAIEEYRKMCFGQPCDVGLDEDFAKSY